ncbi:MAG: hypothetical protein HS111_33465 [Kofleriaceae bacterium]|nr:hypothetical protein [Kofleriaceae bacterium]
MVSTLVEVAEHDHLVLAAAVDLGADVGLELAHRRRPALAVVAGGPGLEATPMASNASAPAVTRTAAGGGRA